MVVSIKNKKDLITEEDKIEKTKDKNNSKWYSLNKLLSRDRMVNFVMSHRGGGKTFACKRLAIKKFLRNKEQWIYLRRYKSELKGDNVAKWFDDVKEYYPNVKFEVKGHTFYINGEQAGFALALTQQVQIRSTPFPNVNLIIFDEFVLDDRGTNLKYLNNEVKTFLEIMSTVVRSRDNVRVICCGNSISYVNPYFEYWKIRVDSDSEDGFYYPKGIKKGDAEVVLELYSNEQFQREIEQTKWGRLIKGTEYGDYAINNTVLLDNDALIMKSKPKDCRYVCGFKYDNKIYGIWYSDDYSVYHINTQYDKCSKYLYAITNADQVFEMANIKTIKKEGMLQKVKAYYLNGLIYYNSQTTKKDLTNIFKILGF